MELKRLLVLVVVLVVYLCLGAVMFTALERGEVRERITVFRKTMDAFIGKCKKTCFVFACASSVKCVLCLYVSTAVDKSSLSISMLSQALQDPRGPMDKEQRGAQKQKVYFWLPSPPPPWTLGAPGHCPP